MTCLLTVEGARVKNTVLSPLLFLPLSCLIVTHPHPIQQQESERLNFVSSFRRFNLDFVVMASLSPPPLHQLM